MPSALNREHLELQNMKFLKIIYFLWVFLPSWIWIRIPNPDTDPLTCLNPDPIRIRNTVQNDWPVWFPHLVPGCRGERDPSPTAWNSRRPSLASLSSAQSATQFCYKEKRNIKTNSDLCFYYTLFFHPRSRIRIKELKYFNPKNYF